jgi:hypothetical protein
MASTFSKAALQKLEPVLIHGIGGVVVGVCLLVFGGLIWLLNNAFPAEKYWFELMEKMDVLSMLATVFFFCVTLVIEMFMLSFETSQRARRIVFGGPPKAKPAPIPVATSGPVPPEG